MDTPTRQDIDDFIASQPLDRQERLKQHQWRLDQELNKFKNPTARLNRMIELFWEGVDEFQQSLKTLENPSPRKEDGPTPDNVVQFKKD